MPLDLMPSGRNLIVFGTAADSPRLLHARFLPLLIFQQQITSGCYAARLYPTKQTPGRVHTAGGRATYREMCRHVYTHICFLLDLLLQLLLKLLLLSRSAHSHAVRLNVPHPLRTVRVPTIELSSGHQLLLYLPASAGIPLSLRAATPSPLDSFDDGGTAALHAAPAVSGA